MQPRSSCCSVVTVLEAFTQRTCRFKSYRHSCESLVASGRASGQSYFRAPPSLRHNAVPDVKRYRYDTSLMFRLMRCSHWPICWRQK